MNKDFVLFTCGEEPASLGYEVAEGDLWASPRESFLKQFFDGVWRVLERSVVHHDPVEKIDSELDTELRAQAMAYAMGLTPESATEIVEDTKVIYAFLKGEA